MYKGSKFRNKRYYLWIKINFMSKVEICCTIGSISNLVLRREEITHLKFQPRLRCEIDGEKICDYVADFSYFDRQETADMDNMDAR